MARTHVGPSHKSTPKSVLKAPKQTVIRLTAAQASQPSKRRRRVLERRAARTY